MRLRDFCIIILKPYRLYLSCMLLTGLFWGIYVSFAPYMLKIIIDRLTQSQSIENIYYPAIAYVALYFAAALNFRLIDWIKYKILPPIKKAITMNMFNHIKEHSHHFFQNHFAGSISNKFGDMVGNLEALINSADEFFASFAAFFIAIIVMYTVNPLFSMALLVWCLLFFIISAFFSKTIYQLSRLTSASYTKYSGTLVDILSNMSSVRLFARTAYEGQHLDNTIEDLVIKDRSMLKYVIKLRLTQDISLVTLLAILLYTLVYLYNKKLVSIGDFALILTITMSIFQSMWYLANKLVDVYRYIGKCAQAMSIIEEPHEIIDAINAPNLNITKGMIVFKDVCFQYHNNPALFTNTSVTIAAGSKVGLVGYSGSGKSTFINLILRLYDIQSGAISIDGQDIKMVTQNSVRKNISMIPQDVNLFHRSLFENIQYGNIEAPYEEVIEASKKAHCHEFITQLEKQYDTLVGERGIKLSGGQRQRIAIARAFLENAPILILDEATSSLDSVTEKYIQESLHLAIQNRTTLIIAHRLSTLLEMDRILVFKNGVIIEDGTHTELMSQQGCYAKMWAMQSNGFLPDIE